MMEQTNLQDLQSLLRQKLGDSLVVEKYTVKDFLPPGENYGSKIVSVDAIIRRNKNDNNSEELNMIAKLLPPTLYQREMFDSPFTFKKEIFMYNEILPAYRKLEIDNGVDENEAFNSAAICYGSRQSLNPDIDFDDNAAIVLENLKTRGYYMCNRRLGCDLIHSKLTVKELARFHSLGIAMKYKNPEFFEILKIRSKCLELKNTEDWENIIKNNMDYILNDPMLNEHYANCCKAIECGDANSWKAIPDEPWSTIIHADFWINNFMFHKTEDNHVDDIKFVDFQNYLFLSPTRELAFFLGSSINQQVMKENYDELINLYYNTLIERLRLLNSDVTLYCRDSFDERMRKDAKIEFSHCICMLKIITMDVNADNPDANNVKNLMASNEGNETYRNRLRDLVFLLHERHWLD